MTLRYSKLEFYRLQHAKNPVQTGKKSSSSKLCFQTRNCKNQVQIDKGSDCESSFRDVTARATGATTVAIILFIPEPYHNQGGGWTDSDYQIGVVTPKFFPGYIPELYLKTGYPHDADSGT